MRLSKERLAELLVERDNEKIEPIVVPTTPAPNTPYDPWRDPYKYPYGPIITYADKASDANSIANTPNTSEAHPDPNVYAQQSFTDGKEHQPSFIP